MLTRLGEWKPIKLCLKIVFFSHLACVEWLVEANIFAFVCVFSYISIYLSTDRFVVLQLFSVARQARCFKLRSKPDWHKVSLLSYSKPIINVSIDKGFFSVDIFSYTLWATGVFSSGEELCFCAYVAAGCEKYLDAKKSNHLRTQEKICQQIEWGKKMK